MMEQSIHNGYFRYRLGEEQYIDEEQMLLINKKDYFIPCLKDRYEEQTLLYRIGAMIPLKEYLNRRILSFEAYKKLLLSVLNVYEKAVADSLNTDLLQYSCDYIFIEEKTHTLQWAYLPVTCRGDKGRLAGILQELALTADVRDANHLKGFILGYASGDYESSVQELYDAVKKYREDKCFILRSGLRLNILLGSGILITAAVFYFLCFAVNYYGWKLGMTVIVTWSSAWFFVAGTVIAAAILNLAAFLSGRPNKEKTTMKLPEEEDNMTVLPEMEPVPQKVKQVASEKEYDPFRNGRSSLKSKKTEMSLTASMSERLSGALLSSTSGTLQLEAGQDELPFLIRKDSGERF